MLSLLSLMNNVIHFQNLYNNVHKIYHAKKMNLTKKRSIFLHYLLHCFHHVNLIIQLWKWDDTCFHEGGKTETITKIQVFWDVMLCCLVNRHSHRWHYETSYVYHIKFSVKTEQIIAEKFCFHEGGKTETITKIQVFWDVMLCCLVNCHWHWWHYETSHVYQIKFSVKTEQITAEKCKIHIKSVLWEESAGNFFYHHIGHCGVGGIISHYAAVMLSTLQCSVQQ